MRSALAITRNRLELRHMRYFLAVAETLNFGRAAEQLGVAQPNLSQQIKALEEIIGTRLFDRTQRSVRLSTAGAQFLAEVRQTLAQADAAILAVQRAGRGEIGRLNVGYVGSATYTGALVTVMRRFREACPDVELELTELEMREQLEMIARGALDVGFIRPPVDLPPGVRSLTLMHEEVLIALPTGHPAAASQVDLAALAQETFITPRHAAQVSFGRLTNETCVRAGFVPKLGPQAAHFVTVVSMVGIGLGVALVPQSCRCLDLPGVSYHRLAMPGVTSSIALAWRPGDGSPIVAAFLRQAQAFRGAQG